MSEPKPMSPQEAVRALRRERRNRKEPAPSEPPTPSQTGLAIASMSVGILVTISAVPAGILLAEKSAPTLLSLVAFACVALVMGAIGRRNAMGVAGLALASIALVETASVYGYISHQAEMERLKEVAIQKEKTAQERERASLEEAKRLTAEAERRTAEIQFEQQKKKLEAKTAEANARKAKLESEESIRREREDKIAKEQEAIASAAQARAVEDERVMQQWKDAQASKKAEEERKLDAANRKHSDGLLMEKMLSLYQALMDDYQKACAQVGELRAQKEQIEKDVRLLDLRISNAETSLGRLINDGDGPQREKITSDIRHWSSLRDKTQDKLANQQDVYTPIGYDLSPSSDWRSFQNRLVMSRNGNDPNLTCRIAGDNLASLHRALQGALREYPYDGTTEDMRPILSSGSKLLFPSPSKAQTNSGAPTRRPATIRLIASSREDGR